MAMKRVISSMIVLGLGLYLVAVGWGTYGEVVKGNYPAAIGLVGVNLLLLAYGLMFHLYSKD